MLELIGPHENSAYRIIREREAQRQSRQIDTEALCDFFRRIRILFERREYGSKVLCGGRERAFQKRGAIDNADVAFPRFRKDTLRHSLVEDTVRELQDIKKARFYRRKRRLLSACGNADESHLALVFQFLHRTDNASVLDALGGAAVHLH